MTSPQVPTNRLRRPQHTGARRMTNDASNSPPFRCGFVALVGAPNAGKSTLLNHLMGTKLAITSPKPQTTRDRITGIINRPNMQAIIVDTPGIHTASKEINKAMVETATEAGNDADVIVHIVDAAWLAKRVKNGTDILNENDLSILSTLKEARGNMVIALNKSDALSPPLLLPIIAAYNRHLDGVAILPISAMNGDGVQKLVDEVDARLPVHPALYPDGHWTEVTERFLVSEVIRETIITTTEQEIPYASAVSIRKFDESERTAKRAIIRIQADIIVERPSQKGIMIGRRGEMIKRIGSIARQQIETLVECQVYLELFVKVEKDWTKSAKGLKKVGFQTN